MEMKINIDGQWHEFSLRDNMSVQEILELGDKTNALQNYELSKITGGGGEEVVYNGQTGVGSLDTPIPIKDEDKFAIEFVGDDFVFTIIVNGQETSWDKPAISYEELINLSNVGPYTNNPNVNYTIIYYYEVGSSKNESFTKGNSVEVKDKMIFNVTKTDRS